MQGKTNHPALWGFSPVQDLIGHRSALIRVVLLLLLWAGCDVPFDPKGEYTEKPVIYLILDPTKTSQFARVYRTYNVDGLDPLQNTEDTQVRNASITVFDSTGRAFAFRDTILKRDETTRYASDVFAYYTDRLLPSLGGRYSVEVIVPNLGVVTSTVTVPQPYQIVVNGSRARAVLADSLNPCNCIEVSLFGGQGAKGHLTRFFINYMVIKPGQPALKLRKEVPIAIRRAGDGSAIYEYPKPDRIPFMEYPKELFNAVLSDVLTSDPNAEVKAETVTFISHALEPNLYNYYLRAHGFGDPFSIRLDLPDYTNIKNGLGVFGALAVDSLTLSIR